jgi:photosystem II stability/assembly factor-like uncharacterized protein
MKVSKTSSFKNALRCLPVVVIFSLAVWGQTNAFSIQIASEPSEAAAQAIVNGLRAGKIDAYWVKAEVQGKGTRYRVRIGRFSTQNDAKAVGDRARSRGLIKEYIVTNFEAPSGGSPPLKSAGSPLLKEAKAKTAATLKAGAGEPARADRAKGEQKKVEQRRIAAKEASAGSALQSETGDVATPVTPELKREVPQAANVKPPATKEIARSGGAKEVGSNKEEKEGDSPELSDTGKVKPPGSSEKKRTSQNSSPAIPGQPDLANTVSVPTASANLEPKIASPPVADALADFGIGNNNWKVVRRSAETDKNLRTIYFVDTLTGWAAGDAGAVYRTTDGGRSWKPLLSGAAANIDFIFFVDWNNGWMLGEASGKGDGETVLFLTNNGGRTWTNKPFPNVLSLSFTDAKNGWAVGKDAVVLKTNDGGEQWTPVTGMEQLIGLPVESSTYNFGFRDVFFLDANNGWMLGNFYGRARNNIGGLFVTSDGGNSWKRIPLTLQTQYSSGRFTPGELHTVQFTDLNTGSVTGEMYDGEGRFFFVLHTRDGGKTWEQFRTPSRAVHNTQFLDLSNGWMAVSAPREGGAEAVVYDTTLMRTDNGGMSWQNDFVTRGRRIHGVFFLSPTKGWAVGDRGMILRYEEKDTARP